MTWRTHIRGLVDSAQPLDYESVNRAINTAIADDYDSSDAETLNQQKLNTIASFLACATKMFQDEALTASQHFQLQSHLLESATTAIKELNQCSKVDGAPSAKLHFQEIVFTSPLSFHSINCEELTFTDCVFSNFVDFLSCTSANAIRFSQCTFNYSEGLLIRLVNFPKPVDKSQWKPSFLFEHCKLSSIEVWKSEVFLFFKNCKINTSTLELAAVSSVQFLDCHIDDGIIHSIDEAAVSFELVPRCWHAENQGWSLENPATPPPNSSGNENA